MTSPNAGYLAVVLQVFAVFVAISILLGRIYSLAYLKALGIPTTEVRLNAVDYSVISPDVAVLAAGLALLLTGFVWGQRFATLSNNWRWSRIRLGGGLSVASLVLSEAVHRLLSGTEHLQIYFGSGGIGLLVLLPLAMSLIGGAVLADGFPNKRASAVSTAEDMARRRSIRDAKPLIYVALGIYILFLAMTQSTRIAQLDANNTLLVAPEATIEFVSDRPGHSWTEFAGCQLDSLGCTAHVVLVSDRFIYLRPDNSVVPEEEQRLFSVPIEAVTTITYGSR